MTWVITDNRLGLQKIADTSTTKNHQLGEIVQAEDRTYGGGEFIYLKGVANTIVGSLVTYDPVNSTTTLIPNTANLAQPVAVAMSANVLANYGWYQISGAAIIKKTGVPVTPGVVVYIGGTAGRVKATAASGKQILGARAVNAATVAAGTSTITVLISRPHAQGAVA